MFSRFSRRGLCFLLALVTLCMCLSPALTQPAEAMAAGVVAGTVAIGATAVVAAMLSGLGIKPGSDSSAWDNLVSQVENHLTGLGYIVDGAIKVASFKPTDDPEKLKAAIAQDIVGLTAQWLSDEDIIHDTISSDSSLDSTELNVLDGNPDTIRRFDFQVALSNSYAHYTVFYDDIDSGFRIYFRYGYYSSSRSHGLQLSNVIPNGSSKTSFGYITLPNASESTAYSYLGSAISGPPYATGLDVDVSSVPANFTDIPAAYPSWVSSGVQEKDRIYLPLPLIITEPIVTPTEPPETTEAPEPTTEPTDPTTPLLPGSPDGPVSNTGLQLALGTLLTGVGAYFGDLLSGISGGLERLGDRIANLFDGFLPTLELIKDKLTQGFIDLKTWFDDLLETLHKFFSETFPNWMQEIRTWLGSFFAKLEALFISVFTKLFVPAAGYWDAKIIACKEAFPLFNSIITTGHGLGGFFSGLGSRPPVIYIDLGNSASWAIGGTQKFLDLTWYAQYKPTVDTILSGFLWLLFAWRFFLRLPGLLRGEGGTIDRLGTYFDSKNTKDGK